MSSACLRGGECLEAPEPGKQEVGPGVVGLVAQDGAAGVAGDDGGDTHQPQPDRPGLPPTGSSGGQGEQLGEGEDVAGQGHDQAPDTVLSETLQREAVKPGVLRAPDAVLAAGSQPVADLEVGELSGTRVGGEGGGPVVPDVLEA